ncbi:GumC family protein [Sphingomonas sp. CJ20]
MYALTRTPQPPAPGGPGILATHAQLEGGDFGRPLLLQYWQILLRWRWIVIGIVATSVAVGVVVTLLTAPEYAARVQIEISREQQRITNVQGVESGDDAEANEFYATQYSLLRARPLAERVAESLDLGGNEAFFASHGVPMPGAGASVQMDERRKSAAAGLLLSHVTVEPVRGSRLVDVRYTSRNPALAARIANEWARAFSDSRLEQQFASTAVARRFLEERLKLLRQRLEESERRALTYASETGIVRLNQTVGPDGRTQANRTLVESDLDSLNLALNRATENRIAAEARAKGASADASLDASLAALRQQRTALTAQYAQLMVQHERRYPPAMEIAVQIATVDAALKRETQRIAENRQSEYREAMSREQSLLAQVTGLKARLDEQQRHTVQYNIYQREADTNRQLYDALLQRFKEIGVAGTVGASQVVVVEPALVPGSPKSPNLPFNISVALAIGFALSAAAVIGLEQIDEGVREPGQVERFLGLATLGTVPMFDRGDVLEGLRDSRSDVYEAYLSVCSALAFATTTGFPRTLSVVSTRSGEGKSVTAWALCLALSRTGRRVLFVDADMRSPSAHLFAGVGNERGLSNYLAGDQEWTSGIVDIGVEGICVLPAGPMPPNPAELLSGTRMSEFLLGSEPIFDHVIIDTPPVLGLADAPLIGSITDASVLVVESNGPTVGNVRAALKRMSALDARIAGAVLTKMASRGFEYRYGYGYGYGYGRRKNGDA